MGTQPGTGGELSRRELMKRGMRTGAYAAPLVLTSVAAIPAAAQVSRPGPTLVVNGMTALSIPIGMAFAVTGTGYPPSTTVYLVLQNTGNGAFSFISVTSDSTGAISGAFNTANTNVTLVNGPGSYTVTSTLTMPSAMSFTGAILSRPVTITPTVCMQPLPFYQDFLINLGAPNFTYNVFYKASNATTFTQGPPLTTDAFGVGGVAFPVTNVNTSTATSVLVVATIPGQPASTPTNPAASFTSNIVTAVTCTAGGSVATAQLIAAVIQETTSPGNLTDYLDVGIFNGVPNTAFDIYLIPNGTGTPIKVTTVMTNALGNITAFVSTTTTGTAATSFRVNAVLAGTAPTAVVYTFNVSGSALTSFLASAFVAKAHVGDYTPQASGLHQ